MISHKSSGVDLAHYKENYIFLDGQRDLKSKKVFEELNDKNIGLVMDLFFEEMKKKNIFNFGLDVLIQQRENNEIDLYVIDINILSFTYVDLSKLPTYT